MKYPKSISEVGKEFVKFGSKKAQLQEHAIVLGMFTETTIAKLNILGIGIVNILTIITEM